MALVIRHEQLPIASVGWDLEPGCSQMLGLAANMVAVAVSYCWFRHPGCGQVTGGKTQAHFPTPSFSRRVWEDKWQVLV